MPPDRYVDWALGATMVLLPLLPTGPVYLGMPPGGWAELGLLMLLGVAVASLGVDEIRSLGGQATSHTIRSFLPFLVTAGGAALVGLDAENAVGSAVFARRLTEVQLALFGQMDQSADPLYPLRVWLTKA